MTEQILLFPVLLPAIAGLLMVLLSKRFGSLKELIAVGITLVNLVLAVYLYPCDELCGAVVRLVLSFPASDQSALLFCRRRGLASLSYCAKLRLCTRQSPARLCIRLSLAGKRRCPCRQPLLRSFFLGAYSITLFDLSLSAAFTFKSAVTRYGNHRPA